APTPGASAVMTSNTDATHPARPHNFLYINPPYSPFAFWFVSGSCRPPLILSTARTGLVCLACQRAYPRRAAVGCELQDDERNEPGEYKADHGQGARLARVEACEIDKVYRECLETRAGQQIGQ